MGDVRVRHTPQQRRAIETIGRHMCVDAGAGTGKTRVLVDRIVHLIDTNQADLDEIVAITFTDKAAAEMKSRLRNAAREKAPLDDPERMSFWRDIERRVDTARISTIHAFCSRLLRENALRCGLDPDFSLISEPETYLLREEILRDGIEELLGAGDEHAKRLAVHFGLWSLRGNLAAMLAQRGSVSRILAASPDSPRELLDAWKERLDRYQVKRLEKLRESAKLAGFRSRLEGFAGECAKSDDARERIRTQAIETCEMIQGASNAQAVDRALRDFLDSWNARGAASKNWPSSDRFNAIKGLEEKFQTFCSEYLATEREAGLEEQAAHVTADFIVTLREIENRFQEAKRDRTALDFDDLLLEAHALLSGNEAVRARAASGIKHLLIDEFQDTDHVQVAIAWLLARTARSQGAELFIVGDPKQSIYRFRGAEVEVFAENRERVDARESIDENFRTVPEVLGFINEFCESSARYSFNGLPYQALRPHRAETDECRVEFLCPRLDAKTSVVEGREAEAELIARRLVSVCASQPVTVDDPETRAGRNANFGDVVILLRTMSDLHVYENALKDHGIPYNVVQGAGFYERQEVHDLINMLKAALEPWNGIALCGFLRSPLVALTDEALLELGYEGRLCEAFHGAAALADPEMNRRLAHGRALVQGVLRRQHLSVGSLLRVVLAESGLEAILLAQPHGKRKVANVRKVVDLAAGLSEPGAADLRAFVRYVDDMAASAFREGDAPLPETQSGVVTIMSVHQAKGLEFPIVVVADIAKGRQGPRDRDDVFFHRDLGIATKIVGDDGDRCSPALVDAIRKTETEQDTEEHARILYVALTRARDWLLIAGAEHDKPAPDSWFEWLDAQFGISDRDDGETIAGDAWRAIVRRTLPDARVKPGAAARKSALPLDAIRRRVAPISEPRGNRIQLPVSRVLELPGSDLRYELRPSPGIPPERRGSIVHRLFETWAFEDDCEPPIDRIVRSEPLSESLRESLRSDLTGIADRFRESSLFERLCAERPVERELQFTLALGEDFLAGAVDILTGAGTIVDFKTGTYREDLAARYLEQVQIYAAALTSLRNEAPRAAVLYYVDDGTTTEVDLSAEATAAALERARSRVQTLRAS